MKHNNNMIEHEHLCFKIFVQLLKYLHKFIDSTKGSGKDGSANISV